jgi:hypothetical protein
VLVHPKVVDEGVVDDSLKKYPATVSPVVNDVIGTMSEVDVAEREKEVMANTLVVAKFAVTLMAPVTLESVRGLVVEASLQSTKW